MGIVYVIRNDANGKEYVGQTVGKMRSRFTNHCCANKGMLPMAIRKYGRENFSYIENEVPEELMDRFETNLISFFGTIAPNGYNLETGGHANKKLNESTKKIMSELHTGEKNYNYGKHFSEDHKRRISESNKGKPCWRKGIPHTEETKRKIAESNRGQKRSEEARKKMSLARIGHKNSPETRAKLSAALMGHPVSDETKKKWAVTRRLKKEGAVG